MIGPEASAQVEQDFKDAQLGKGTRLLTYPEAGALLDHCARVGWAFQTMEAFECANGLETSRIDRSLLGLSPREKSATSLADLISLARDRLDEAAAEPHPFIFQVWVDTAASILGKKAP